MGLKFSPYDDPAQGQLCAKFRRNRPSGSGFISGRSWHAFGERVGFSFFETPPRFLTSKKKAIADGAEIFTVWWPCPGAALCKISSKSAQWFRIYKRSKLTCVRRKSCIWSCYYLEQKSSSTWAKNLFRSKIWTKQLILWLGYFI